MILLAIDPSSTCTGYAIFDDQKFVESGKLSPARAKDAWHVRCASMFAEIADLVREFNVTEIVIEETAKHVFGKKKKNFHLMCKACGMAIQAAMSACPIVHLVPINVWSKSKPKSDRALMSMLGLDYDESKDKGLDAADAVGLGLWWLNHRKLKVANV